VEASYQRLRNELTMVHPTIWKFIDGLRKSEKQRDMELEQMVAGYAPPAKKKKYQDADKRIVTILNQFMGNNPNAPPQSMWEFLQGISHNYQINPKLRLPICEIFQHFSSIVVFFTVHRCMKLFRPKVKFSLYLLTSSYLWGQLLTIYVIYKYCCKRRHHNMNIHTYTSHIKIKSAFPKNTFTSAWCPASLLR